MGLIITPQADIDAYFASEATNQSSLKNLEGGLGGFMANLAKNKKDLEENKPTPDYFLVGGAVDCILTGEKGEFEKQYYVSNLTKMPSEVEIKIVESVFNELANADMLDQVNYGDCYDSILAAADSVKNGDKIGWQNNWKADTRVAKLIIAGLEYFDDLKASFGLKIISSEMRENIDRIVNSLKFNAKTKKYFDRDLQADQEHMDFYYQLPMYFTYKGVECKALMDLVVVHKNPKGEIIRIEPIDLKTMSGNTLQFTGKVKQHRYDIQAAWYTMALAKHFDFPEEKIDPFKFVVESTTGVGTPLVFEITPQTLIHGKEGAPEGWFISDNGERDLYYPARKGFEELMAEYIFYQEQGFKEDIIFEKYPDVILIDWLKGIV
tara:strand:+ start:13527 stop:14663 length:1137 start_codon:yes stop_codon:yes gene_type:complete